MPVRAALASDRVFIYPAVQPATVLALACLSDVEDRSIGNPIFFQNLNRDVGLPRFVRASITLDKKGGGRAARAQHYIDAGRFRDTTIILGVLPSDVLERQKASESELNKFRNGEALEFSPVPNLTSCR